MLTVFEALLFAARLRLPESVPDVEKCKRVNEVMEKLGIATLSNVRIGYNGDGKGRGISGGEMRRVSIGLELVAKPDVLLLDEPTSGASTFPPHDCLFRGPLYLRAGFRVGRESRKDPP